MINLALLVSLLSTAVLQFSGCVTEQRGVQEEPKTSKVGEKPAIFDANSKELKEQLADGPKWVDPEKVSEEKSANGDSSLDSTSLRGADFDSDRLKEACEKGLKKFPGKYDSELLSEVCADVEILPSCVSRNGQPIYHYNRPSRRKTGKAERILTFAVTHGDEIASGAVARSWANRLSRISPRNEWRIVPVVNPDGFDKRTRTNAAGVDVNRNYPSSDWDELALKWWKTKKKSDKRRYPGPSAASEPETVCTIDHIEDFKPDLIISIHTPLGLLDFDGPKMGFPQFKNLPWISLGTYPGSLGRYMWHDRKVPVLTIELKSDVNHALSKFDQLQDISGQVALTISKTEDKKKKSRSKN